MIVVSDTSPISYLVEIELDWLLPMLYGDVVLPESVYLELASPLAPSMVRHWVTRLPPWAHRRQLTSIPSERLDDLDAGERAAIALTLELHADVLLVDERKATVIAEQQFGIFTTGTLGVLREAHKKGLTDGVAALARLTSKTTFYYSQNLLQRYLRSLE